MALVSVASNGIGVSNATDCMCRTWIGQTFGRLLGLRGTMVSVASVDSSSSRIRDFGSPGRVPEDGCAAA